MTTTIPRTIGRASALLAVVAAATSCDALIGLGDEPSGAAPTTSSSTGDATSSSTGDATSSSTGDVTSAGGAGVATSTAAGGSGGDGGGGAATTASQSTVGAGGSGGAGGEGPVGTPCGECPDADCAECDGGRCVLRTWTIEDTERGGDSSDTVINRFGRGFVVTDDWIAFQRRFAGGAPVVTLVRRNEAAEVANLGGFVENGSIAGIAASGDQQVIAVVEHVANFTAVHRIDLDAGVPTLASATPGSNVGPLGLVAPLGPGREFLAVNRYDSSLVRLDLTRAETSVCLVAAAADPTAPIDLDILEGASEVHVGILQYLLPQAQRFDGAPSCLGNEVIMDTIPLPSDVQALAGAQVGGNTFVLGFGTGGGAVVVNGAGVRRSTIASLALDANAAGVYFPAPAGGLQRCDPGLAPEGCTTIIPADAIGQVGQVRAMPWGAYAVGMLEGTTAAVACVDTRD